MQSFIEPKEQEVGSDSASVRLTAGVTGGWENQPMKRSKLLA
jgi:hypothetical protein